MAICGISSYLAAVVQRVVTTRRWHRLEPGRIRYKLLGSNGDAYNVCESVERVQDAAVMLEDSIAVDIASDAAETDTAGIDIDYELDCIELAAGEIQPREHASI